MAADALPGGGGGDYFAPDAGQRIDAQGRVTYDFTGHIHAQGLDLDASPLTYDSPVDRKVSWLDAQLATVAEVFGYSNPTDEAGYAGSSGAIVRARLQPGYSTARARLEATDANGGQRGIIEVINNGDIGDGGGPYYVARVLDHQGNQYALIDRDRKSHFVYASHANRILTVGAPPAPGPTAGTWTQFYPGRYFVKCSMSGYSNSLGLVANAVYIDGIEVCRARFYFNEANAHRTFPTALGYVDLAAGTHTWSWGGVAVGGPPFLVDGNDDMSVSLHRGGANPPAGVL
ncbi:MAG: hypothetical protein JWR63_4291 [Conexibacter sp.]|nr:hypothetical protein [Conexibacter sp.]